MSSSKKMYLLAGTHKGVLMFTGDYDRKKWELKSNFFKGVDVNHAIFDTRSEPTIFACVNSSWWGPDIHYSKDFGETWIEPEKGIQFKEGAEEKVKKVWQITPGLNSRQNELFVGVDPAALFKTEDGGKTWKNVDGLISHPTRKKWNPGMGGMMVHSICLHSENHNKLFVGISAAGTFVTQDGGKSWKPKNKGVLADFMPDKYPEFGQCVHHMESHPAKPDVLYQQNHCGVYRSDDSGEQWIDISEGLPSRFGFPLQINPNDPDMIYVIPEEGAEFRAPVNTAFAVHRSKNKGENWEKLTNGLPQKNAFIHVHRQAMTVDNHETCGIYVGTSTGQIFFSRDEGENWETLADYLPPIFSLHSVLI